MGVAGVVLIFNNLVQVCGWFIPAYYPDVSLLKKKKFQWAREGGRERERGRDISLASLFSSSHCPSRFVLVFPSREAGFVPFIQSLVVLCPGLYRVSTPRTIPLSKYEALFPSQCPLQWLHRHATLSDYLNN